MGELDVFRQGNVEGEQALESVGIDARGKSEIRPRTGWKSVAVARAGVKADGTCRCESGGPPEYGAGVFSRRRTPMDARLASLLRPGAAITLSLNNNSFRMVQ